jgi:hypothetical protein
MNLIGSLLLLAASVGLLIFGRGRNGEGVPFLRKLPWVVGQLFAVTIMCLFAAGLIGRRRKLRLATLRTARDPPLPAAST